VHAALTGAPRYDDPEFRKFLRRWQLQELKARIFGRTTQKVPQADAAAAESLAK
jgi:hypothetical protein